MSRAYRSRNGADALTTNDEVISKKPQVDRGSHPAPLRHHLLAIAQAPQPIDRRDVCFSGCFEDVRADPSSAHLSAAVIQFHVTSPCASFPFVTARIR